MTRAQRQRLRNLQGARVSVALEGGTRVDDCYLVSAGGRSKLWLVVDDEDLFVDLAQIVDIWEYAPDSGRAA